MEIINLDEFKTMKKVTIDGQMYEVYGISVGEFIDGKLQDNLAAKEGDIKAQVAIMVETLTTLTNIPVEVLKGLSFKALNALISIAQGGEPKKDDGEPQKGNE